MVAELVTRKAITSEPVRRAFLDVPREHFVPEIAVRDGVAAVYSVDRALVTKTDAMGNAISSASGPSIMAPMLENLALEPGMRVLEIGAGTGYNAALLASIVGPRGRVTSVDIDPAFVRRARAAVRGAGFRVQMATADGRLGLAALAPFDRIVATVAFPDVPRPWFDQLRDGGMIELPIPLSDALGLQLIPTLRKEGPALRSTQVVCGGFMGARSSPDELGPAAPLITYAERIDGPPRSAMLSGAGVGMLTPAARRRAVGTLAGPPRRRPVRNVPDSWSLQIAVTATDHPGRVNYTGSDRWGVGIVGRRGDSLAVIARGMPAGPVELLTWGEADAAVQLDRIVDDWRKCDSPALDRLRIRVTYGRGGKEQAWRRLDRGACTIALDWSP